jgi:probable phosphoglycerate mutase
VTPVIIIFDGGSLRNPGHGYGSYHLAVGDSPARIERLDFGSPVTNNEAEYRALIGGLEDAVKTLEASGESLSNASVEVFGDSQLVLNQVAGKWKVRHAPLLPLRDRAQELVARFGSSALIWQPRIESVRVLGH